MTANFNRAKERRRSLFLVNILSVLLLCLSLSAISQESKKPESIVVGDKRFILHTILKKETLYSISKKYDCTQEEVLANNKEVTGAIKKGMVLRIPDHTYHKPQSVVKIDESKFIRHQVVSGDNYYQLKLKYGVEEEELLKLNPELKEGLRAGMVILVPKKSREEADSGVASPGNAPARELPGTGKTFNIGLYLPITAAVTDSTKTSAKSLSFLAFYQGVLMAVDQLSKSGIKAKLFVYDTEKQASTVESLVRKPEFLSLDLLIGPVYPEFQRTVSELSAKNRIPMISPLSPDDKYLKTNPWYFQLNPVRKIRIEATADYILKEFSKERIIFLETENGSPETKAIKAQIARKSPGTAKSLLHTYNIWTLGTEGLESQLLADKPNILVMAELNEVNVSIAMNRLALLSKKYPFILVGIQEFIRMQSLEIENLHNVNLRFLTNSFVDYKTPPVTTFVENFKNEFGTEPSLFDFQGYDVTTFFLRSLQKSGNLSRGISPEANKGLLHTAFHFTKVSDFGGFTNDNFTVVEYSGTYEVKSLGSYR